MSLIFDIFHFDISGNDFNEEHSLNKSVKYIFLSIFHFDISGNDSNEKHLLNIFSI